MSPLVSAITLAVSSFFWAGAALALAEPEEASALRVEQAITSLERLPDVDSLAAAGLLSTSKHRDQSVALMARAVTAAPLRPDLLWLQAEVCLKGHTCDPAPIEARLREVDPANAAGWFGELAQANASNDEPAADAVLATIAQKVRFDTYYTTLVASLSKAILEVHGMSAVKSVTIVIGYLAAQPIPPYTEISKACKGERLEQPAVKETCRGIARAFLQSDTYLSEMIGSSIAKRVWPQDSPQWKAAAQARRVYDYQSKLFLQLYRTAPAYMEQYLKLCATHRREQDVWAALIIAAGEDPNPPAIAP